MNAWSDQPGHQEKTEVNISVNHSLIQTSACLQATYIITYQKGILSQNMNVTSSSLNLILTK